MGFADQEKEMKQNRAILSQENGAPDQEDSSILRPSITTSIGNLKYFAETLQNGTPEVRYMLTHECDVILECKVCRNLFRSLANFLSHKRFYCKQDFETSVFRRASPNSSQGIVLCSKEEHPPTPTVEEPRPVKTAPTVKPMVKEETLHKIVFKLASKAEAAQTLPVPSNETQAPLQAEETNNSLPTIVLEPICQTQNAVYQSVENKGKLQSIRQQVRELRKKTLRKRRVWVDNSGQVAPRAEQDAEAKLSIEEDDGEDDGDDQGLDLEDRKCRICKVVFPGLNATIRHMREAHVTTRLVFPCPACDKRFYRPASVRLHLNHDHHKSAQEINRLRKLIYRSSLLVGIRPWENPKSIPSESKKGKQGIQLRWNYKDPPPSTALTPNPPNLLTPSLRNNNEQNPPLICVSDVEMGKGSDCKCVKNELGYVVYAANLPKLASPSKVAKAARKNASLL